MKIRTVLGCVLASVGIAVATSLPASAAGPQAISKCSDNTGYGPGTMVTRDAYLTKDLTCQKGFVVADGATLDLRGHTLTGTYDPNTCNGSGCPDDGSHFQPGHAGIILFEGTAKNGRVDNWDYGVRVGPDFEGKPRGISRLTITNSTFDGVFAIDNTDTVTISRSVFGPTSGGVYSLLGGGYRIDRTTFTGSNVTMTLSTDLTVTNSTFTRSSVNVEYGTKPVTLKRNLFTKSAVDGVKITGSDQPVRVGRNVARDNKGHGMVFTDNPGGVVDLGGNRAYRNKTQPQCLGVVCR